MKQIKGITLRDNKWQVRTTYKGQKIYRQFSDGERATHTLARRYLQEEKKRIDMGQYVEVHKTLEEVYLSMESKKRDKRESSRAVSENNFRHIGECLGRDRYIDSFTDYEIQNFEEEILSSKLKPRTQGAIISLLKELFKYALNHGWIQKDYTEKLKKPKVTAKRTVSFFTEEQIQKLIKEAERKFQSNPNLLGMLALGIYGGLRSGEMLGLQWRDIDFKNHIIHVERQYHATLKRFTEPKTDSSKDAIPMCPELQEILKRILNRVNSLEGFKETNCVLTAYHKGYTGKPLNRNSLRRGLIGLTNRCGLPIETELHSLRRTCCTRIAKKDLGKASAQLRHADIKTTWKYYTSKDSLKDNMLKEMYPQSNEVKKGA